MSSEYSAHPALASEQLQNAKSTLRHEETRHCAALRYKLESSVSNLVPKMRSGKVPSTTENKIIPQTSDKNIQNTLPDRTDYKADDFVIKKCLEDCVGCSSPVVQDDTIDEPDYVQHRHSRNVYNNHLINRQQHNQQISKTTDESIGTHAPNISHYGCASGLSSAISSPADSTASSPLSTPTRYVAHLQHNHQHCCQHKSTSNSTNGCCVNPSLPHHNFQRANDQTSSSLSGCKKAQKFDPRLSPSPYRQLLPIALCILSFATVFSVLIVYMDTTEIRHQQFRLNMSRDYELNSVAQDDPTLIAFLREIHMRKYPMHFLKNRDTIVAEQHYNFSIHHDGLAPEMAHYVANLLGGKTNGAVIQSLTGTVGYLLTAPWLSETLDWTGIIVEPEPRRYFTLRKQNAYSSRMQVVHACVSNNPYPKEITIHNEEAEVRINSLLDEETSWFNSRVKCFPLYTIMLACDRVEYELLSLGVHGYELEILQTLPFDKIKIEIISIHLVDDLQELNNYIQSITKFLVDKSYKLQKKFGRNYFYQRINSTNRTRKKDVLLLKTP